MDRQTIESLAASLVREFLSRKGLKATLTVLDDELPREENSISNRHALAKSLNIVELMKKNKESLEPFKTMIEVLSHALTAGLLTTEVDPLATLIRGGAPASAISSAIPSPAPSARHSPVLKSPATDSPKHNWRQVEPEKAITPSGKSQGDVLLSDVMESELLQGRGQADVMDNTPELALGPGRVARPAPKKETKDMKPKRTMLGAVVSSEDRRFKRPTSGRGISKKSSSTEIPNKTTPMKSETILPAARKIPSKEETLKSLGFNNATASPPTRPDSSRLNSKAEPASDPVARPRSSRRHLSAKEIMESATGSRDSQEEVTSPSSYEPSKPDVEISQNTNSFSNEDEKLKTADSRKEEKEKNAPVYMTPPSRPSYLQPKSNPGGLGFIKPKTMNKSNITLNIATELRRLIFGETNTIWSTEWSKQAFCFSDLPGLMYGIVQKKGGPCGILAAVQAHLLKEMLFKTDVQKGQRLKPSRSVRTECLHKAITHILWKAGEEKSAVVVIPSGREVVDVFGRMVPDHITETLILHSTDDFDVLSNFILDNMQWFEKDGAPGVILMLYSAILSRGIDKVKQDMDQPENGMMGQHSYCTQDMVNLLATGRAVSNVFNDEVTLDSGSGDVTVLKGVTERAEVGLLSLFEHYKSCQVESNLKTPRFPIWIVCSESHFSVLFSTRRELISDWKAERRFDLYYWDGLGAQESEIRLTMSTIDKTFRVTHIEQELVPPLEHCIRTKWKDVEIDWNGTEPIL